MDPCGFQGYITRLYADLEVTKRALWKLCLQEDMDAIRSGNKINEAERELLEIETYINYASFIVAGGIKNPEQDQVCRWINKAQEAAFCLEDQIAMYTTHDFELDDLIVMKSAIGKKSIKDLTSTIKNCIKSKPDTVQQFESNFSKFLEQQLCEISPFVRYSHSETAKTVLGMDNTIEELKKLLRESYSNSVILVIGEKGSGKTTLVKSLYEDNHVRSSFGPCSWVDNTAQITDLASFLRKVLKVEGSVEDDTISDLEIMDKVQETFHGEGKGRYLVVLDDIEDTCALHTLKHVLKGYKGKIICLTTRKNIQDDVLQDDAKNDSKTIMINPLEESDAHKLLVHVAFPGFHGDEFKKAIEWKDTGKLGDGDLHVTEVTKKITILNQVLVKCMGNPWNIQMVGKLLETNPSERWDEIQEQINGMLIGNREIGKADPPIALDDHTLSLKSLSIWHCFLYCLAFPEGLEISAQKLARLWMAEGFVQDSPLHSQEHEAQSRLQDLIRTNLLVERKKGVDGKVLKCSINQHIHPLALKMCKIQKFCRFLPGNTHPASPPSSTTSRYRVLSVRGDGVKEVSEMLHKDIRLRSLLYFGSKEFKLSFRGPHRLAIRRSTYRLLRTLELEGARLGCLPRSIGCLVCLRYLGLRNTQLEDLPASFNRLKKLLCLDIRDNYITSLNDVSTFTEMRHLHLAKSFRNQSVLISEGLRSLVYLRTLSGTADGGNLEQELSHLNFLRKLSIKVSNASSKNICAAVSKMEFLHSLAITAYDEDLEKEKKNTSEGEEALDKKENISNGEPHKNKEATPDRSRFDIGSLKIRENIRKLKLGGHMGKLSADRISMMHSLTHLYLWDSKLDVDILHCLQGLRDLLLLSICNSSTYSKLSCTQGGYRKLKKLSIVSMENLTECIFGTGAMKNLEELKFTKCDNLTGSAKGLEHILSLKRVYLSEMQPDFVKSVKGSVTGVQIHEINMHCNKSSRAATAKRQTKTHKPDASPAIGGEGTKTKTIIDTITPPRSAKYTTQDTKSGHKLLADAQKSYEHMKPLALPQSTSSKKGKEPLIGKDTDDDSDEDKTGARCEAGSSSIFVAETQNMEQNMEIDLTVEKRKNPFSQKVVTSTTSNEERTPEGSQTTAPEFVTPPANGGEGTTKSMVIDPATRGASAKGTTQNTKSCDSDGDKGGQTSSMTETRQSSEQPKEQLSKCQSSDISALIPCLQESELHDDDSAAKNAFTTGLVQSSDSTPSTNQESSSRSRVQR